MIIGNLNRQCKDRINANINLLSILTNKFKINIFIIYIAAFVDKAKKSWNYNSRNMNHYDDERVSYITRV